MKKILLTFILFTVFVSVFSQQKVIITGYIKNSSNEPLPFSNVLLAKAGNSGVLYAFAHADANGFYSIEWEADTTVAQVEGRSMGYNKDVIKFRIEPDKQKYEIDLKLEVRTEEIEEVSIVATPVVTRREDTTYFNLSLLRDSSEVVVEDLIKKLPGMEVGNDGSIKYKGKNVNKVLLDGDDLFEGNYTLGTKNIQADHVEGISAIENYTRNPLLRGVEITEDVAINLEFTPGLSLSNNIRLGAGMDERYNITHKAIAVTKKVKAFTLLDHNTLGRNAGSDYYNPTSHISNIDSRDNDSKAPVFLGTSLSSVQGERNESYFGSINIMPHLTETFTARVNIDYFSDKAKNERSFSRIITTDPNNPIVINQSERQADLPQFFNVRLYTNKFINETSSVANTLSFSRKRNSSNNSIISNSANQRMDKSINDYYFSYNGSYTNRMKESGAVTVTCNVGSDKSTEKLLLMPGIDFENNTFTEGEITRQDIQSEKQSFNLDIMYYVTLLENHTLNVALSNKYFNTDIYSILNNNTRQGNQLNDVNYRVFVPEANLSYKFVVKKLDITPVVKLQLYNYDYTNNASMLKEKKSDLLVNGTLNIRYEFIRNHKLSLGYSYGETAPGDQYMYDSYVLTSNRTMQNNEINFEPTNSQALNFSYSYNPSIIPVNYSIGANYNKGRKGYQSGLTISESLTYQTMFMVNNETSSYGVSARVGIRPGKIFSNVNLNASYNKSEYYNSVNSASLNKNASEQWNYGINLYSRVIWKFILENRATFGQNTYFTQVGQPNKIENFNNSFQLFFKPLKNLHFKAYFNYSLPLINNLNTANKSLDAFVRYQAFNKRLVLTLEGKNLVDQRRSNLVTKADYYEESSSFNLQRQFFLLTAEWRF